MLVSTCNLNFQKNSEGDAVLHGIVMKGKIKKCPSRMSLQSSGASFFGSSSESLPEYKKYNYHLLCENERLTKIKENKNWISAVKSYLFRPWFRAQVTSRAENTPIASLDRYDDAAAGESICHEPYNHSLYSLSTEK